MKTSARGQFAHFQVFVGTQSAATLVTVLTATKTEDDDQPPNA
ncbi:hypothetical protein QZH41_010379 [Actinostola sp. cb2023]|nr:hypothetical protein QZH41_010379 [Actinostola sp. cb2023]